MSRESYIQEECCTIAEKQGWLVRATIYAGRKGCPDRHMYRKGVFLPVEFKKRGEEPNGLQRKEHGYLNDAGFFVHVIDNVEDFKNLMWKYETWFANNPSYQNQPKIRL